LVLFDDNAPRFEVRVAYGTSQRTTSLHRGEFAIFRERSTTAYTAASLSYGTKFDLTQVVELPYTTEWFGVPPARHMIKCQNSAPRFPHWCALWRQHSALQKGEILN
jgi:hypothetical protein